MRITLSTIFILLFVQAVHAQSVSGLKAPGSPGFSILNYEPSAVMRPATAKQLGADVLNSFDKDGKLMMNLGLEFSPYWLGLHPNLTREKYLHPNAWENIVRSFSISAATVKDSSTGNNMLGTGIRFKVLNGHPNRGLKAAQDALHDKTSVITALGNVRGIISIDNDITIDAAKEEITKQLKNLQVQDEDIKTVDGIVAKIAVQQSDPKKLVEAVMSEVEASKDYQDAVANVSSLLYQPEGFILEFAGATGFNTTNKNKLDKYGAWGNLSYAVSGEDIFTLTTRYLHQSASDQADTLTRNFDAGLAFLKQTSNFNISLEAMVRWYNAEFRTLDINNNLITTKEKEFTYRVAIQGSYVLSKDISVNLSLGKDFQAAGFTGSGYFSMLGVNYTLFSKEVGKL